MDRIKSILATPTPCPTKSEFSFEFTQEAAETNWNILRRFSSLEEAIKSDGTSPLSYGSEFRSPETLSPLFENHPLWSRFKSILAEGVKFPLEPLSNDLRKQDLLEAIEYGNHKGASENPELLEELIKEDVTLGHSLIIPLEKAIEIDGALMAPMNIIDQNTITELGELVSKLRLTHNQSKAFSSKTLVNSRVKKEELQACMYGHCLLRLIHFILALRFKYPNCRILVNKFDYKSAYRRAHLNGSTAIQSITQFGKFALIALRQTFGGAPCPYQWGCISEPIADLANALLELEDWNPVNLCSPFENMIPEDKVLDDDIPFTPALPLVVDIPIGNGAKTDIYIDDNVCIVVDNPEDDENETRKQRARAAVPLAIHIATRPLSKNEPIPRKEILAQNKLKAEAGLAELQTVFGWDLHLRSLTVQLPTNKAKIWLASIREILEQGHSNADELETLIGRLNHIGTILAPILHFLSRIRSLFKSAKNRRTVRIYEKHIQDLKLSMEFIEYSHKGVSMNYIALRAPTHCFRADACPWGIGGYSSSGQAWRYYIAPSLLFRATLNMLEFLASVVTVWVEILEGRVPPLSCILSMTDSTTTAGWLRKSNFQEEDENTDQLLCKQELARSHASRLLASTIKEYPQWFRGEFNAVSDALSRDYILTNSQLTSLLRSNVPEQLPDNFRIAPLPREIDLFISQWLRRMPAREPPREQRQVSKHCRGLVGNSFVLPSNCMTMNSSTVLNLKNAINSLQPSRKQCGTQSILRRLTAPWLQARSEVPWTMWLRPFGTTNERTQDSTPTANLHTFYCDSTQDIRRRILQQKSRKPSLLVSSGSYSRET